MCLRFHIDAWTIGLVVTLNYLYDVEELSLFIQFVCSLKGQNPSLTFKNIKMVLTG